MSILMIKVKDIGEASKLAFAHMKPGVLTNHVMTAAEYKADIEAGVLYAHTWPGGVFFLRGREGYQLLSYFINDPDILPGCPLPDNTITEIAYKPEKAEARVQAVRYWEQVKLKPVFERIRLTRLGRVEIKSTSPLIATTQDIDNCHNLMQASFDRVTGHLPTYKELVDSIEGNCVLCIKDSNGEICGLLRYIPKAASTEIRQMAIREDMRGQGLAHRLLDAFIEKCGHNKSTVWMKDGYTPAHKAYSSAGFTVDGWRSSVLAT